MRNSIKFNSWSTFIKTRECLTGLGMLCLSSNTIAQVNPLHQHEQYLDRARQITKEYALTLQSTLKSALKTSGPMGGLKACNISAPLITSNISKLNQWQVSRTSLKYRSSLNAPSIWEEKILQSFELQKQRGVDPATLEFSEVITVDKIPYFRYMKAIPTAQKPCLACHGKNLKEPLNQKILALYPHDKATGYQTGDIRGAFSLSVVILESD